MSLDDPLTPVSSDEAEARPSALERNWPTDEDLDAWRAVAQDRIDALHIGLDRVERRLIRMDERAQRGGPVVRLVAAAGPGATTVLLAALGDKGRNVPFLGAALIAIAALAYVGSVTLEGFGVTLSTAASARPSGPAPQPTEPQE